MRPAAFLNSTDSLLEPCGSVNLVYCVVIRVVPFLSWPRRSPGTPIEDADVVICSSSGWSHRVQTTAPKIVYCHNPARWLYQPRDYFPNMPEWLRRQFVMWTRRLRRSDAAGGP